MKILLAEDSPDTAEYIIQRLEEEGYVVDWASDGIVSEKMALSAHYDAIIMDLGLPGKSGDIVIRDLRRQNCLVPTLILTANNEEIDCLSGFLSGADDYLNKPFSFEVLLQRLRALARRRVQDCTGILACRDLMLNMNNRTVYLNDTQLELSEYEYKLLKIFLENQERVLDKLHLMEMIYSWTHGISSNVIEVHIHSLRKKLGKGYIKTRRGLGYQLA